jgi:hypothetical protein
MRILLLYTEIVKYYLCLVLNRCVGGPQPLRGACDVCNIRRINAVQRSATISMWAHKHCTRFRGLAVLG